MYLSSLPPPGSDPRHYAQMQLDVRLVQCIEAGDLEGVEAALDDGADPNSTRVNDDEFQRYMPLHRACLAKNRAMVSLLLSRGADANALSFSGESGLAIAAKDGNAALVATLLTANADVNIAAARGGEYDPLVCACMSGSEQVVSVLLAAGASAKVQVADGGMTALIAASMFSLGAKRESLCKLLLEHGADPLAENEEGINVLTYAPDSVVLRRAVEVARAKQVGGWGEWLGGEGQVGVTVLTYAPTWWC